MKPRAIIELCNDLEARYPVATWVVRGVHIWPLLRFEMYWRLDDTATTYSASIRKPWWTFQPLVGFARRMRSWRRARRADSAHDERPPQPVDAVFLTMSTNRQWNVGGAHICKFSDPLRDVLEQAGRSAAVLEYAQGGEYRTPRYRSSRWIQHWFDLTEVRQRLCPTLRTLRPELGEPYAALLAELPRVGLDPQRFDRVVAGQLARILRHAQRYERLLQQWRPAVGLMYGYYDHEALPFALACRRLGITSIDVQHGVNGDDNVFYGRWRNVPPEGYALLPRLFWCWTARDQETIRAWNQNVAQHHDAVVGGNLAMRPFADAQHPLTRQCDAAVAAATPGPRAPVRVMFAMQWIVGFTPLMLEVLRQSPPELQWWVRLHPGMLTRLDEMHALVKGTGANFVDMRVTSEQPIYGVLRHVDVLITAHSSAVLDALHFGVHSVLTHESGGTYFQEQITQGWAEVALTPPAIIAALLRQASLRQPPNHDDPGKSQHNAGTQLLLDLITRRSPAHQ